MYPRMPYVRGNIIGRRGGYPLPRAAIVGQANGGHPMYANEPYPPAVVPGPCPPYCDVDRQSFIQQGIDPKGYGVTGMCSPKARYFPLGFAQDGVAAGATVVVTQSPQQMFRGERLVIPSNIGIFFDVVDITIGNKPQLVATGANSGVVFSEVATDGIKMNLDTAQPGIDILLRVTNTSQEEQDFRATLYGAVIDQ